MPRRRRVVEFVAFWPEARAPSPLRGMAHACTQAPKPSHYSTLPSRACAPSHSLESLSVGRNQFACSICNLGASASTSSLSISDRNRTSAKSRIRQHPMLTTLSTQKARSFSPKHSRTTTSRRRIAHESRAVCRAKYKYIYYATYTHGPRPTVTRARPRR